MGFTSPYIMLLVIGVSLSELCTSEKDGMNIAFTKVCVEIWTNGTSIMHSQKFTFKNWIKKITYKCFQMYIHHANVYQSSLLTFRIRLVRTFIKINETSPG